VQAKNIVAANKQKKNSSYWKRGNRGRRQPRLSAFICGPLEVGTSG
jgi:hypothetical protein